ncbi:hypothetical protein T4D_6152 [Trichinella pseudospiralis]|uniref:Uncharacterized protein n=1 Tax=Trichinella pseudospiralis TaxID=6337 RepID=A0A0V1F7G3_TRIPS|nr:hypothetical protein T4D_6152 [Trichinella pseudospiralis]
MHISLFLIEIYGVSFADRCGSAANKISLSITLMQQIGSRIEISVPLNFIFHERILFMGRKMSIPLNKIFFKFPFMKEMQFVVIRCCPL